MRPAQWSLFDAGSFSEILNQQVKDLIDFLVILNGIRQKVFVPKDD
jgi:hypothetical protein